MAHPDAATVIHVCEDGHADDHHIGNDVCSRCGADTAPYKLDALARFAVERQNLIDAMRHEIGVLKRAAEMHVDEWDRSRCFREARRLEDILREQVR